MDGETRHPAKDFHWKVLDRNVVFRSTRGMEVARETVALPDGRVIDDYYQIASCTSVIVYALTEDCRLVTLRHYMHGARRVGVGLPGGHLGEGEDPLGGAQRELLEETGYEAARWSILGRFTRNANQGDGEEIFFLARDARRVADPDPGDLEEMVVALMDQESARAALFDGSVPVAAHAALIAMGLIAVAMQAM